ncbi:MAG: DoxX family protein [Nanoarchaeota archaeon]
MFSKQEGPEYARILVRIAISLVFLWFGLNQIFNAEDFMGYLPEFLLSLSYAETIVILNGIAETVLSALLIIGFFPRIVSFILGIHLISIIISLGYNDIAIRDFGLMLATFSITIGGADKWCIKK